MLELTKTKDKRGQDEDKKQKHRDEANQTTMSTQSPIPPPPPSLDEPNFSTPVFDSLELERIQRKMSESNKNKRQF